jgi:hypothetical protein
VSDDLRRVLLDLGFGFQLVMDEAAQMVGVVGGIGDDMRRSLQPLDQAACLSAVAPVPGRDGEADRQAEGIGGGVDLGRQVASGAADGESFRPPF